MSHVVEWFDIPDEESELVEYLAKAGELWAFAWNVDPAHPEYPPAPIAEFFRAHGAALTRAYQQTSARWAAELDAYWKDPSAVRPFRTTRTDPKNVVHLGSRAAVQEPRIHELETTEGGVLEPTSQPGVQKHVGGTPVVYRTLDDRSELFAYKRTTWLPHLDAYSGAHLSYEAAASSSGFARLGKRAFSWIRRWTPHTVKVSSGTFSRRATAGAAAAADRKKFLP